MNLSALPKRVAIDAVRWAPKGIYTRAIGWGARRRIPRLVRRPVYEVFASWVGASLEEVELPLEEYPSLGSFFSRRLRPGARPSADDGVVAPCDGAVAASGTIHNGVLIQAKGHDYQLGALLADDELAASFEGGQYVTIYLSPRDYHRVHSPVQGRVLGYDYIPGRLLPVSPAFVESVPQLFARNERLVFRIETEYGPVALAMVGATGVGNISVSYSGHSGEPVETRFFRQASGVKRVRHEDSIPVERGDELGMFQLGSTVVLVLPKGMSPISATHDVRMGKPMSLATGDAS